MSCMSLNTKTKQVKLGKVIGCKKAKGNFDMQSSVKCVKYTKCLKHSNLK